METFKQSYIYKIIVKIILFIENLITRSYIYEILTKEINKEEIVNNSIFSKIIYFIFSIFRKIFNSLKLNKVFTDSIFAKTYIWSGITIALAPVLPTMATLALVLATTLSFIIKVCLEENFTFKYSPLNIWILFYIIIYLFYAVTSLDVTSSIKIAMVVISFILFYFVIINSIETKKQLSTILYIFIFIGVLISIYGIYQYVTTNFFGTKYVDQTLFSDIKTRVISTFDNPNVLGEYLLLIIPMGVSLFFINKGFIKKTLIAIIIGIMTICLALTYSRGCYLGLVFAGGIFILLLNFKFIILFLGGLIAMPFVLPPSIMNRFNSIGNMSDSSTTYRISIWKGSIDMIKDYWYRPIGQGTTAFNSIYPLYAYSGVGAQHSHNLLLQLVIEIGFLGLALFLIIIFKFYQYLLSGIKKGINSSYKIYIIGFISAISAFMMQSIFDNTWYNMRIILIFWIFIALAVKTRQLSNEK